MSDPGLSYRTREEVQEVRISRDPINFVKKIILENKIQTEEEIKVFLNINFLYIL